MSDSGRTVRLVEPPLEIFTIEFESRGGDGPYGWGDDAYRVMLGERTIDCFRNEKYAKERARELNVAARGALRKLGRG